MSTRVFFSEFVKNHFVQFFDDSAQRMLADLPIHFVSREEANSFQEPGLILIDDQPVGALEAVSEGEVFGVEINLLDCLELEHFSEFKPMEGMEIFWRNDSGSMLSSWNLVGLTKHFLQFEDERRVSARDNHGRISLEDTTLSKLGILRKPIINEYMYALLAVAKAYSNGGKPETPAEHVKKPILVISHDCDQLRGNDFYTQAIRVYRAIAPLLKLKLPQLKNLWWVMVNFAQPYRYYLDDLAGMLAEENRHGYRSSSYLLNGMGGRFGARSGSNAISKLVDANLPEISFGAHYNYQYALEESTLDAQLQELASRVGSKIRKGRAHYLTFDPDYSFRILQKTGISVDESVGFAEENSYRVGYAGGYQVWDANGRTGVTEIPLVFMDANVTAVAQVDEMNLHIEEVGGLQTLLFHPGTFDNPEASELQGAYARMLDYFSSKAYRNMLPEDVEALLIHSNAD